MIVCCVDVTLVMMAATAHPSRHARPDGSHGRPSSHETAPVIATHASGPVALGESITDTATLAGVHGSPSPDTITFTVYAALDGGRGASGRGLGGPRGSGDGRGGDDGRRHGGRNDGGGCGKALVKLGSVAGRHGTYTSPPFTPTHAGTYRWVASFAGDHRNAAVSGRCGSPGETSVVEKAVPAVTTTPSRDVDLGGSVWDEASLVGGHAPGGTVTFDLYRDPRCRSRVFASTSPLHGASASSSRYVPKAPGVYYWRAAYSGDRDNASATTPCGPGHETVLVGRAGVVYTIGGDVAVPLYPGAPAQPIDLTFHDSGGSPHGRGTRVSRLTVAIASVTGGSNTPYACTASDFVVTQYAGPYPFSVPHGTSSLSTILPSLPTSTYPSIRMIDRHDTLPGDGTGNQDGCEGATVHLAYTGAP